MFDGEKIVITEQRVRDLALHIYSKELSIEEYSEVLSDLELGLDEYIAEQVSKFVA